MSPILEIQNLTHIYSAGTPFEHTALDDVSFSVERGEFIGIIGHTGSGKSTLMQHLNGLLRPTTGKVLLDGQDIWASKKFTRQARFRVGLVFQYPEYQLFEETVYKDIAFGPKNMKLPKDEIDRRVREAAGFVGLTQQQLEASPFDLSGGQKRRVAIAGVIAMEPEVLILDEPTAGLDPAGRGEILANIEEYRKKKNATIIMVSHSMNDVALLTDRLIVMNGAHLAMDATPVEVFTHAEELVKMGLDIPEVTQVFLQLRNLGLELPPVYTMQQAVEALKGGILGVLKDITLGQYFPGKSLIHRLDPRTKLVFLLVYIVALFLASGPASYGLMLVLLVTAIAISQIPLKAFVRGMKPMLFILIFTGMLNLFFTREGTTLWSWEMFCITTGGITRAIYMVARILMLISGTFLLTYTTSPIALTDGLESLLNPLKKIKVPVHELAMMMCIALRFIPTLIEETDKIMSAQKARGADFETGSLFSRIRALIPILVPLFISAFRRADELATAMECRCYHGGDGRTKMKLLRYRRRDFGVYAVSVFVLAGVIVLIWFGL